MTNSKTSAPSLAALCVAMALALAYMLGDSLSHWPDSRAKLDSGVGDEILIMRTAGGLLEVSTMRASEHFDQKIEYSLLGVSIGETVPHILVPAVYRYHIELAPEWPVRRVGQVFTVGAPAVKPSLPVAVDLGQMQKDVGGSWVLVAFNADEDLDTLERQITAKLAEKAGSAAYIQLQREYARQTVEEFVRKWLLTQTQWNDASKLTVRVSFADEPERR